MLHRIDQKLYGFASLIIVLSLLTYGGVALFLDQQNEAAQEEQGALVSAREFATLQQMFIQLRTWERDLLLQGESEAESHFVQTIQRLKQQLNDYQDQATQQHIRTEISTISASVEQYENNFNQLSQLLSRHRLLETDMETIYQSIETAGLSQGDAQLLRKVFLLNHFQVNYLTDGRPSGFQALKIVLGSMAQAFAQSGYLDDRVKGYFAAYERTLGSYSVSAKEIKKIGGNLEQSYIVTIKLFEKLSGDLAKESNNAIASSIERRHTLKKAMYVYFPLVSVIVFFLSLLLARKIVTPINKLLATINEVKAGNSQHRFSPMGASEYELNQLGLSFNSMLDTLDDQQNQMLGYQAELTRKVTELAETNEKLQVEITERMVADKEKTNLEEQLRQSQKMEAIGTLAGGIAHDFNNILAAIIGYAQLTRRKFADDTKEKRNLGEVLKAAERGKQLVQQILMFSRKSEGGKEQVQISTVVEEALKLLRQTIPATTPIHATITPQAGIILADATQIHQIVMNLCTNAYHAVRDVNGAIDIRLDAIELDQQRALQFSDLPPGAYARLVIKDTGTGMPAAIKSRIFEPFFTTKRQGEGTGMGLAVVYGIIHNLGGAIEVKSEVGEGTIMHVLLPMSLGEEVELQDVQESLQSGSERILFVDDESMLATLGKEILDELGYHVTATTSAKNALKMFNQAPSSYDLIISDQSMPEISGADLAKAMMHVRPDIPIILCTGYSETIDADRARALGIKAFLMKPIDQNTLASTIREVLDAGPAFVE